MKLPTKSRWLLAIGVLLFLGVSAWLLYDRFAPIDYSKEEEPFCSMAMPIKSVYGDVYMDGGSVVIRIVDRNDKKVQLDYIYDHSSPSAPYTKVCYGNEFSGEFSAIPLKNAERARMLGIRLLNNHGTNRVSGGAARYLRLRGQWNENGLVNQLRQFIARFF